MTDEAEAEDGEEDGGDIGEDATCERLTPILAVVWVVYIVVGHDRDGWDGCWVNG